MIGTPYLPSAASAAANKPYVLIRRALERSGKAGVGKMAVRESERLVLIRPYGDALAVHTLHWPDELRSPADAVPKGEVEITDEEAARADALIEALGDVDMSAFRDDYADALQELLAAEAEGAEPPAAPEQPERAPESVDLMTALEAAVADAREGGADVHHLADRKKTAKKTSKTAGKKTAAKKTPAKRSGTRGTKRAG